tara:strand:- start:703 stop:843 length:141 start_codon:yes stop_codon:yes gene_type:complete
MISPMDVIVWYQSFSIPRKNIKNSRSIEEAIIVLIIKFSWCIFDER